MGWLRMRTSLDIVAGSRGWYRSHHPGRLSAITHEPVPSNLKYVMATKHNSHCGSLVIRQSICAIWSFLLPDRGAPALCKVMAPCENGAIRFVQEANKDLNFRLGLQTNLPKWLSYTIRSHVPSTAGLDCTMDFVNDGPDGDISPH